jgi:hypothetical protein
MPKRKACNRLPPAERSEIKLNSRPVLRVRGQHQLCNVEQPTEPGGDIGGRDPEDHQRCDIDRGRCSAQGEQRDLPAPASPQHVGTLGAQLRTLCDQQLA